MQSLIQARAFFEVFLKQKEMPLSGVLMFFKRKNGSVDTALADQFILRIHNGGALALIDGDGNLSAYSADALKTPERYSLVLQNPGLLDEGCSGGYLALGVPDFPVEDSPPEFHCTLEYHSLLRVVGEKAGAERLVERIRAFTHLFAWQLSNKNLSVVASFFSEAPAKKYDEPLLAEKLQELEAIYGEFSYFDRVSVYTVYHGKDRNKKLFREMALPKGISRDARRGESEFYLVAMHTPGGSMLNAVRIALDIIEENGLLRIINVTWYVE